MWPITRIRRVLKEIIITYSIEINLRFKGNSIRMVLKAVRIIDSIGVDNWQIYKHYSREEGWYTALKSINDIRMVIIPDSKVHGANSGPTWVLSDPDGPHVGPRNHAIREGSKECIQHWSQTAVPIVLKTGRISYNTEANRSHSRNMRISAYTRCNNSVISAQNDAMM